VPEDPTAHIESHPYLKVIDGPETVDVGGYEGQQFDVLVTGSPNDVFLNFAGYDDHATYGGSWDVDSARRLTFVPVDGQMVWMFTEADFDEGEGEFHDLIVSAIEFL
jgi:hypothetical protein